jgi:hypothetical protein
MLSAGALGQKPHDDGLTAGAPPAGFAALAAQAQGSEKRERGPSVDMGAVPPLNLDYWDLHPHMGFAGVVMLEDDTKMQLEVLFGMIDRDHSGVITHDDFVFVTNMEQVHGMQRHSSHETVTRLHCSPHRSSTHVTRSPGRAALPPPLTRRSCPSQVDQAATTALMQREVLRKWEALRMEMDFNGDGCVSAEEFINGMKRTAMKLAPGAECFTAVDQPIALADGTAAQAILKPASHHDMLMLLNESINNAVKNLCKELFDFFNSCGADAANAFARVQAARAGRQPAQVGGYSRRMTAEQSLIAKNQQLMLLMQGSRPREMAAPDAATLAAAAASGSGVAPIPAAKRAR